MNKLINMKSSQNEVNEITKLTMERTRAFDVQHRLIALDLDRNDLLRTPLLLLRGARTLLIEFHSYNDS